MDKTISYLNIILLYFFIQAPKFSPVTAMCKFPILRHLLETCLQEVPIRRALQFQDSQFEDSQETLALGGYEEIDEKDMVMEEYPEPEYPFPDHGMAGKPVPSPEPMEAACGDDTGMKSEVKTPAASEDAEVQPAAAPPPSPLATEPGSEERKGSKRLNELSPDSYAKELDRRKALHRHNSAVWHAKFKKKGVPREARGATPEEAAAAAENANAPPEAEAAGNAEASAEAAAAAGNANAPPEAEAAAGNANAPAEAAAAGNAEVAAATAPADPADFATIEEHQTLIQEAAKQIQKTKSVDVCSNHFIFQILDVH